MGNPSQKKSDYEANIKQNNVIKIALRKLFGLLSQIVLSNELRIRLIKAMGTKIGKDVFIGKYCIVDDTFPEFIKIEDRANISFAVTIIAHDASKDKVAKVIIKKGAYIGSRAVILPGVIIGEEAIVGAGAVVTSDVPSKAKVVGVPARVI
jgi:acetyltransferase-like isoleucine patch superfamily enzyme